MTALSLAPLVTAEVWAPGPDATLSHGATVHRSPGDAASCINPHTAGHLVPAEATTVGVTFCATCWPGRRCVVCGDPCGTSEECGPCSLAAVDAELRDERAREWAA